MRGRTLILFTVMLACLTYAAKSIAQDSNGHASDEKVQVPKPDFNEEIYYKNRLDFSLESGWLPGNIPFVFDFLLGGGDGVTPLKYTLIPTIASLRWQMERVRGPSILRGNWDLEFSGALTLIPRGPETYYGAYLMGLRRNFVRPHWRIVPF